jgi:WD40 repeat protein
LFALRGHTGAVSGLAFSPDGQRFASASADQTVKVWGVTKAQALHTLRGHTAAVTGVAFSPDGKRVASASLDKSIKVWDAVTGWELLTLKDVAPITSLAFSPDGRLLVSGTQEREGEAKVSINGHVKVWDATTGRELSTLESRFQLSDPSYGSVTGLAFSPDGKRIAAVHSRLHTYVTLELWDATTGRLVGVGGTLGAGTCVAFSPDNRQLAWGGRNGAYPGFGHGIVQTSDATTHERLHTFHAHSGDATSLAFSPDGQLLATASTDGAVMVWDARIDQGARTFRVGGQRGRPARSVAFSPDGRHVAASGGGVVKVWDVCLGREALALGHAKEVLCVAYSPDGHYLASGDVAGTVKLWEARTGRETRTLSRHIAEVGAVVFSPDGKRLASEGREGAVRLWDTGTGKEVLTISTISAHPRSKGRSRTKEVAFSGVAFSPDGLRLATADQEDKAVVRDAATGRILLSIRVEGLRTLGTAKVGPFSRDGKRLATCLFNKATIWDAATGQKVTELRRNNFDFRALAFSPDGQRLASGGQEGTVLLWDVKTGQEALSLPVAKGHVEGVVFSRDGRYLAAAGRGGTVKVWEGVALAEEILPQPAEDRPRTTP